jgi:hypothetical protein
MDIIEIITLAENLSVIIPLIFYLRTFRQSPLQNHFIGCLIIISGCTEFTTFFRLVDSPIIYGIYNILEFGLISLFFYEVVYKKRSLHLIILSIVIYLVVLVYSISEYGVDRFYSGLVSTSSVILLVHTLVYTFSTPEMPIERYFDKHLYSNVLFNAHNIFAILKNIGFAFAFYYTGKRQVYMTFEQLERIGRKLEEKKKGS